MARHGQEPLETFVVDVHEAPLKAGLGADEGWVDMQVQFLIDRATAGADQLVVGRTVFPPGQSRHERHRHHSAEEFVFVLRGEGVVWNGDEEVPVRAGDLVFHPRNGWHGFRNTSTTEPCEVLWAWAGAATKDEAGYELQPRSR